MVSYFDYPGPVKLRSGVGNPIVSDLSQLGFWIQPYAAGWHMGNRVTGSRPGLFHRVWVGYRVKIRAHIQIRVRVCLKKAGSDPVTRSFL